MYQRQYKLQYVKTFRGGKNQQYFIAEAFFTLEAVKVLNKMLKPQGWELSTHQKYETFTMAERMYLFTRDNLKPAIKLEDSVTLNNPYKDSIIYKYIDGSFLAVDIIQGQRIRNIANDLDFQDYQDSWKIPEHPKFSRVLDVSWH